LIQRVFVAVLVCLLAAGTVAYGSPLVTLTDPFYPNSTVNIDAGAPATLQGWTVELFNQMAQSGYWFAIGNSAVAVPVSSIGAASITQFTESDATLVYSGDLFDIQIDYLLWGNPVGSGMSDLSQTVMITNKSGTALDFHLFEFVNMDLNGSAANEIAMLTNSSTITQDEGTTQGQLSVNTIPAHWQIGDATSLLNSINTVSGLNLADGQSPYVGDAAFAFQWNMSIAGNGSQSISQDMLMMGAQVPEPSSVTLFVSSLTLLPLVRRRRK